MSKVLFLNQPTIGHLNTLLTIALQMRENGHQVHFLVPSVDERSGISESWASSEHREL